MSDNKDIHSFDYEARARQVLSQKPLLSAKDLEVTFSLRGQNSPLSAVHLLIYMKGKPWQSSVNPVPGSPFLPSALSA